MILNVKLKKYFCKCSLHRYRSYYNCEFRMMALQKTKWPGVLFFTPTNALVNQVPLGKHIQALGCDYIVTFEQLQYTSISVWYKLVHSIWHCIILSMSSFQLLFFLFSCDQSMSSYRNLTFILLYKQIHLIYQYGFRLFVLFFFTLNIFFV